MDFLCKKQHELHDLIPLIREALADGRSVRFYPRGVSMLPMLRQGRDSVVFSPLPDRLSRYDLPLYRRKNGKYVLHRVIEAGETYTCIGDSQFSYERGISHGQMIALVTAFYRDGKRYSVTDWRYRAYCVLWHYSRPLRHLLRGGIGWLRRCLR